MDHTEQVNRKTTVVHARDQFYCARERFRDIFKKAFPVGSYVAFNYGKHRRGVTILSWHGDRIRVQGATGSKYMMNSSLLLQ